VPVITPKLNVGYRIGSKALLYRDLRQEDRRLCRKQREYLTTGVVLQIDEPWFAGSSDNQMAARRVAAEAFKALLVHEYGIAPADLQTAHTSIAIHTLAGARKVEDALVVFDTTAGGLRLSAPLYEDFAEILRRLERAIALAGAEALISATELARFQAWYGGLAPAKAMSPLHRGDDGRLLVYAPGSRVLITIRGQSQERELGEPQLLLIGDEERLMYSYEAGEGARGWVADEHVTPAGNEWQRALWDPLTQVIEALEVAV